MKKLLTLALTLVLALTFTLTLAACGILGGNNDDNTPSGDNNRTDTPSASSTQGNDTDTPEDNGGTVAETSSGIYVAAAGRDRDGHFAEVQSWRDIVQISTAGYVYPSIMGYSTLVTAGLKSDGTVIVASEADWLYESMIDTISGWRDIVSVYAGSNGIYGIKSDGTVEVVGGYTYDKVNNENARDLSGWRDIVAIAGVNDSWYIVGLKSDGTVIAEGQSMYGEPIDVSDWRDIVAISDSGEHIVGLKSDGTAVAVGSNSSGQCDVSDWRDITAIATGYAHTVGLKTDGTVVVAGNDYHLKPDSDGNAAYDDIYSWSDIVDIAGGMWHVVGLKSDGSIVAVGDNSRGQLAVLMRGDATAITAGYYSSIALTTDPDCALPPSAPEPEGDYPQSDIWISASDTPNFNLESLRGMTNTTKLEIVNVRTPITDISVLAELTNLTELTIYMESSENRQALDLSPLANLPMLMKLSLYGNRIEDLSPLSDLTMLRELNLSWDESVASRFDSWGSIEDISPLAGLTRLTKLNLFGQLINDLSPLTGLTNLTELNLNTAIQGTNDISPLSGLTNLTRLDLGVWTGPVKFGDISPLADLTSLEYLDLSNYVGNDTLRDIAPLSNLSALKDLRLNGNYQIGDISALAGLTNLERLFIAECGVSDLSPLAGLGNLTWLDAENWGVMPGETPPDWFGSNNITDWSPVAHVEEVYGRP